MDKSMLPIKAGTLAAIFTASVIALVFLVAFAKLTDREVVMLGLVQTMLSVAIGWLLTHGYAIESQERAIANVEEQHQKNLRTYALKAAEKVENLSKEIGRLERFLESELQEDGYASVQEALAAKHDRIESAIHVLNTLRSVNDTSLSDWRGVIPEELDQRRLESQQYERRLESLLDRLESIDPELQELEDQNRYSPDVEMLERELGALKNQLKDLAREVGTPFVSKRRPSKDPIRVKEHCPSCGYLQTFNVRGNMNGMRAIACSNCHANLISKLTDGGDVEIRERRSVSETVHCPQCQATINFELDEWPGASLDVDCMGCQLTFKVSRASGELRVFGAQRRLTQELINSVREQLPPQPWSKGVHKEVADRLSVAPKVVQQAIRRLIEAGVFMQQIDGVLYSPEQVAALARVRIGKFSNVFAEK